MKKILGEYYVFLIIAIISAAGLWALSYLTVLEYACDNEEQVISTTNDSIIDKLETVISYGIKLERYEGLSDEINRAAALVDEGCIMVLEDEAKTVIAATTDEDEFDIDMADYGEIVQDIRASDGSVLYRLYTYYPKAAAISPIYPAAGSAAAGSVIILLCLVILCRYLSSRRLVSSERMIVIIVAGIVLQGAFLTFNYSKTFEDAAFKNIEAISSIADIFEQLAEKGIYPEDIADLDEYLSSKAAENDFIDEIVITEGTVQEQSNEFEFPISGTRDALKIVFHISRGYILGSELRMALMFVATIILAVIVMRESLELSDMLEYRKSSGFKQPGERTYDCVAKALRYGTFLSVTFDYFCMSFSALQIKEWNQGFFGVSPGMAAAMSISICSLASIIGTVTMPSISSKLSGRSLMMISSVVMAGADLIAFFTGSSLVMVIMRFFAGAGSAGIKQVRYIEIAQGYSTEKERSANLTAANNGVIGGLLCGMGLGSVVAGVFGYQATFLGAFIGYVLYFLFEYYCIPWDALKGNEVSSVAEAPEGSLVSRIAGLFGSVSMWKILILVVIPQYMLLMIIVCLIPGRVQSLELPGVVLTYSNLINGIAGLYIGERIYGMLTNRMSPVRIQALMLLLGAASMFVLDVPFFVTGFILVSAMLTGFVDGIGTPVATDLFMSNGRMMETLSDTESLMLYSVAGSAVMMAAPFVLELCEKNSLWMNGCALVLVIFAAALIVRRKVKL